MPRSTNRACVWLRAVQAVAGADTNISVVSIVESRVVKLLKGKLSCASLAAQQTSAVRAKCRNEPESRAGPVLH